LKRADGHGISIAIVTFPEAEGNPDLLEVLTQLMRCALRLAAASAGSNRAARMAMMAITTSNSISVKALFCLEFFSYSQ